MQNKALKFFLLFSILLGTAIFARASELTVAIAYDAPPYVMDHAKRGLEVDIITQSLPGYSIKFSQMGWGQIQDAIEKGLANAETNVDEHDDKGRHYYSNIYIGFVNHAISRKSENMKINGVNDLVGHHVIAWEGAHQDLGPEFERLFSPGAAGSKNYIEIPNSQEQVSEFWKKKNSIAIIDESIFAYFSSKEGHSMEDVDTHKVFLPVSKFRMAFKDEKTRNDFNDGLTRLCSTGKYAALLKKYGVPEKANICQ
ncbi:substrate-binding periplasmic protein [Microbulbifer variabilis]|uniref:substrate-binding periplasmic protein n=1 Tax=Microbulbifer variabilis TaxID=266805 RepID=UPI001CFE33B3|nr:transporter substrate-binding domain-containing protein [Microbulbifer variabilis]